jgi:hypothetical protein
MQFISSSSLGSTRQRPPNKAFFHFHFRYCGPTANTSGWGSISASRARAAPHLAQPSNRTLRDGAAGPVSSRNACCGLTPRRWRAARKCFFGLPTFTSLVGFKTQLPKHQRILLPGDIASCSRASSLQRSGRVSTLELHPWPWPGNQPATSTGTDFACAHAFSHMSFPPKPLARKRGPGARFWPMAAPMLPILFKTAG